MQTDTTSNVRKSALSPDGIDLGQSAADKIGFYGVTPIIKPTAGGQATVVDASGGTAVAATGILTLTGTYNSAIIANAIATLAAQTNAIRLALVNLGLITGS